eukprot:NODE_31453_length_396_cov_1.840149.p3 GENE.NODE_31453_length_396_cov_1.840149~~NODE_31453_length_396_cov_1.840149.p3  ORF type:complete len:50 (+),score=10.40 NODE_31453_length_396_cov_1.840149:235-384(+)
MPRPCTAGATEVKPQSPPPPPPPPLHTSAARQPHASPPHPPLGLELAPA